jgi:hypothetical protein
MYDIVVWTDLLDGLHTVQVCCVLQSDPLGSPAAPRWTPYLKLRRTRLDTLGRSVCLRDLHGEGVPVATPENVRSWRIIAATQARFAVEPRG